MTEEYRIKGGDSIKDLLHEAMEEMRRGRPSDEIRSILTVGTASELLIILNGHLDDLRNLDMGMSDDDRRKLVMHVMEAMHHVNAVGSIVIRRVRELDAEHFGKGGSE